MPLALLFPGQGSQEVGMGASLLEAYPEAKATFEEADDILDLPLSRLMLNGPAEELTATRNAQPALLAHSVAVLRVLGEIVSDTGAAAGHSLGEFSAHVAAGTLPFEEALRAVRLRGELMNEAGRRRPGSMAALLGLDDERAREICRRVSSEASVVVTANLNSPGQVVISGDEAAVEEAMTLARDEGAKRVVALNVSGAFHSPLMEPAQEGLRRQLDAVKFVRPRFPVVSNVTADQVEDADEAKDLLVRQLTSPVRWAESIQRMLNAGVDRFLELGPGSVLTGLNRRNARGVPTTAIGTADDVERLRSTAS